jgi:hypothetical protein
VLAAFLAMASAKTALKGLMTPMIVPGPR